MPARLELPPEHPHVALVTIDRPERANSLDPPTLRELAEAWRRIADDAGIRCAVLTGAGDRVFCAGMDMRATIPVSQRLARGERIDPADFEGLRSVATALLAGFDLGKPLVCAVNGHARAGGLDLMLAAEIRYAVPSATFALEEVALGLYPTGNSTVLLPRQIPWVHAADLLLTARPIDSARAAHRARERAGGTGGAPAARACRRGCHRRERSPRRARDAPRAARAPAPLARAGLRPAGADREPAPAYGGCGRGRPGLRREAA